ncbi:MAG TPA: glycosyltransferase family 39 protein [Candidatus Sulfotelmatobacter sp.]|nr:glycosyltransferase family 39 protein [Candidatus Sulfotelmatobacter sp.]
MRNAAAPRHVRPYAVPWEWALLLAVSVPFLFIGLGFSFLDQGEGIYGTIPAEMLACGDWILPHFNGLPYLEKPPLYFWLTAATLALGLSAEWAARLWSALPALGSVLLTWRLGARLYGREAGRLAGVALATCAGFALHARRASPDLLMVFCLTLAFYGFVRGLDRPPGRGRFVLLYLGIGLGLMTKGLIGLLFPLLILGIWLAWTGKLRLRELNLGWGAAIIGLVALPWHAAVAWRSPGHLWFYFVDNQVLRFLNHRGFLEDDVPISTLGFLVVSFLFFFPWSVFLFARREKGAPVEGRLPAIWAVVVIGFFALTRSKLEYYALPAFPALALLAGGAWAARRDVGRWLLLGAIGSGLVGLWAVWLGQGITAPQVLRGLAELNVYYRILYEQGLPLPFASPEPFGCLLEGLGLALLAGWTAAVICWRRGRPHGSFAALGFTAAGIAALIAQLLLLIEPHHSAKSVAAAILERGGRDQIVVHEGSLEYSGALPLYIGRPVLLLDGRRGDLEFASRLPEAAGVFLDRAAFVRLWQGDRQVFLVTQRPLATSVVAVLPPGIVHDAGLYGARHLFSNRPAAGPRAIGAAAGSIRIPPRMRCPGRR